MAICFLIICISNLFLLLLSNYFFVGMPYNGYGGFKRVVFFGKRERERKIKYLRKC